MDSKNLIWLSSFFALLFTTFCVTRHLDDLNPNIVNISSQPNAVNAQLDKIDLEDDTHKISVEKVELPKVKTPTIVKTEDIKTVLPTIKKVEVITKPEKIEPVKTKPITMVQKPKAPLKKPKIKKPKVVINTVKSTKHKQPQKRPTTAYSIGKLRLNTSEITKIANNQRSNELNKLAYMHSINKYSTIKIVTSDLTAAKIVKRYLQTQNVKKHNIKIIKAKRQDDLIKITLTGRK